LKLISNKKSNEKLLDVPDEIFETIINDIVDLIVEIDLNGNFTYVSPQCYQMFGYQPHEVIGRKALRFIHPEDLLNVINKMKKAIEEELHISYEYRAKHKNGSYIHVSAKGGVIRRNGKTKLIAVVRDITEKKLDEMKLKESEHQYRLITENSNDLIRVLNEDFKIEYLNEKIHQQLLGYTSKDLIGEYDIKLNPREDYAKIRRYMLDLFKNKEGIHVSRIRHKNGNYLWFEVKAKMFKDDEGKQKYLFISRNITERRRTELALMESEEKYRNLYENSPNAVLLTSKKGIVLDINSSAEKILGYSKVDLIGRNYIEFDMVNSEQIMVIKSKYRQLLKGEKPKPIELQIKKKNGVIAWILFQSSIIKLDNELIIESIAQDITDKKKAENLIIEENKRLLELNKMKSELISRVSHELKTPITSIFGGAQILLELYQDQTCSEAIEFIELINRGGKRLKILIENLLDASRIESEKLRLNFREENFVEIIKNCINENRYLANKRNIIIELNVPDVLNIEIDKVRIEQVITNLLSNAFKNTPKKGIVKIILEEKGGYVYFTIRDTGIGLTEKEMQSLFSKFGKVERYGQKMDVDIEGSGLGLYISKEIIDLHGGYIWVESAGRNKGSTFYIKLSKKIDGITT